MNKLLIQIGLLLERLLEKQLTGWDNRTGYGTRLEYYSGSESGNPSGNTSNVKFIYYQKLDDTPNGNIWKDKYRKYLEYDSSDNITKVETTLA